MVLYTTPTSVNVRAVSALFKLVNLLDDVCSRETALPKVLFGERA
jgi:hypothetical protein